VSIQATVTAGPAPLAVSFTATGDAADYHWEFGDGAVADGRAVQHTFAVGRWTTTLSARSADGETATQSVAITAAGLRLAAPAIVRYGRTSVFKGVVIPAERGLRVALVGPTGQVAQARTQANGAYVLRARIRRPGEYVTRSERGDSLPAAVRVVPKLVTGLSGSGARGSRYFFSARIVPATSGTLAVKITRGVSLFVDQTYPGRVRLKLDTRRVVTYNIRVQVVPTEGYGASARVLRAHVVLPRLGYGSRSVAVAQLGQRLRQLHYAAPASSTFDSRMLDAVYAFQKVHGLPRTGIVDPRFWQALAAAGTPLPRYAGPADHLEVNKSRQVLYVVRHARVALIVPTSTAGVAGAYTPVGHFSIYRKVGGFDPSPLGTLYDPMYFTGGYAIHGNPSVPPYPASHGCVRVPMWVAPLLYATTPYGQTVYVY
jgi:L,D-transpeptidase-like protein/putative peptidoglycan binding protein/PKD domain-containing protein